MDNDCHTGLIEFVISQRPTFHMSETEIDRDFQPAESLLNAATARSLASGDLVCYGIGEEVLRFLAETVEPGSRTLETGAGVSTLVFALCGARHIAITPSEAEVRRIRDYAGKYSIELANVDFVLAPSEQYLPGCQKTELDFVLIDGKHAFPWPIVDWFFTADRLSLGGVMLLDDVQLRSVRIVSDFMSDDTFRWERIHDFADKTLAFRKVADNVLDVAWHMQPWTVRAVTQIETAPRRGSIEGVLARISSRIRGLVRSS